MKRIEEGQPAVGLGGGDAGFRRPVSGAFCFLDLFLREMKGRQFRAGQRVQSEGQPGVLFKFLRPGDQALARTPRQQRHLGVDAENFQHLLRMLEKSRGHENQAERDGRGGQLPA